jgi:magnesium chelatase subunit I
VRLPLDILLFASANPEDYTNRGRIITPLKDRFGSQIRTHYPLDVEIEMEIVSQEAQLPEPDDLPVRVPDFMVEIVATLSQLARQSPHVNQRSGVSVRLSVANLEALVANALRRTLRQGGTEVVPRISDLDALVASTAGKVEFETVDDGRDREVLEHLMKAAVLSVFKDAVSPDTHRAVVEAFEAGVTADAGEDVADTDFLRLLEAVPALARPVDELLDGEDDAESPGMVASAVELVLEGLHLAKRLNKDASGQRSVFRSRV